MTLTWTMKTLLGILPYLITAILPFACVPIPVPAQTDSQMMSVMALVGASSAEELDEQEMERFVHFLNHPLEINLESHAKLLSSGLLSRYQVASLEDYRLHNGEVLSFSELALIEGFSQEYVNALKPFLSLKGKEPPGQAGQEDHTVRQDILGRLSQRGKDLSYGLKYRLSSADAAEVSLAGRTSYQDNARWPPSSWSGCAAFFGRRKPWKVVLGDYNLRFAQGLALWSGLSLSGFSSSSSFYKRATGLSPSYSWSGVGTHRGVASDFQAGRFVFTEFLSFPGLKDRMEGRKSVPGWLAGANAGYFGREGQVSVTVYGGSSGGLLSADFRYNRKGADYFGEVVVLCPEWGLGTVAGAIVPICPDWKLSGVFRNYPSSFSSPYSGGVRSWSKTSDETGIALGLERHGFEFTVDLAAKQEDHTVRQGKLFFTCPVQVSDRTIVLLRATERFRPYEEYLRFKTGTRVELKWSSAGISARYGESDGDAWRAGWRIEGMLCRSLAGLSYLEFGRKAGDFSAWVRGTLFMVDNWDDRIYSYERDVPGGFTVPAYYGRGFSVTALGGGRFRFGKDKRKTLKIHLRVSSIRYPLMKEPKPSRNEARIQLTASL